MKPQFRILYLEDEPWDAELMSRQFARQGFQCELVVVSDRTEFVRALETDRFDLVLADYRVPGLERLEALKIVQQKCHSVPLIYISGQIGEEMAVEALQKGAVDCILKDRPERLVPALRRALLELQTQVERKRAEEALRHSEELNRAILNALSGSIAVIDRVGRVIAVNEAWQRFALEHGHALLLHDDIGVNYFQTCGDLDHEAAKNPVCASEALDAIRAVAEGSLPSFTFEYSSCLCGRTMGADEHWFLLQATPLSGGSGGAVVLHLDITDRKRQEEALQQARDTLEGRVQERTAELVRTNRALVKEIAQHQQTEQALRLNEEKTRLIIETAHDAFIAIDSAGLITSWNAQAESIFGWARSEAIGRALSETIVPAQYRVAYAQGLRRFYAVGSGPLLNRRIETTALKRDGREFPIELAIWPVQSGGSCSFNAFIRDITERKEAEEMVRNLTRQILRAQEAERKRVARELHDSVSQLLASAKTRIQSLEKTIPAEEGPTLQIANQTRGLLDRCIEEVSRIGHNLMPSELEDLGLLAAVRSLCLEFQEKSGIELHLKHSSIPEELSASIALPLFRIVQEALTNVEKHSEAAHVSVVLEHKSSIVKATITDDGRGFDSSQHHVRKSKRSGMGLMNMKERAALIGGTMHISSATGKGTRIEVSVPAQA